MNLTVPQIRARCEEFLRFKPSYKMGTGPCSDADLVAPWDHERTDCSSFATWAVGVAKHERRIWWGTRAIYADAMGPQKRWRLVAWAADPDTPAPVGCIIVYPGHCGVVTGGTLDKPETVESASSKKGAWRGFRPRGFWARKGALIVAPRGE